MQFKTIQFAIVLLLGFLCWWPVRDQRRELRLRDGFLIVVLFWGVLGLVGAVPFMLSERPHMSLTDSVFESLSGLTTTGATVITGIDALPRSIQFCPCSASAACSFTGPRRPVP